MIFHRNKFQRFIKEGNFSKIFKTEVFHENRTKMCDFHKNVRFSQKCTIFTKMCDFHNNSLLKYLSFYPMSIFHRFSIQNFQSFSSFSKPSNSKFLSHYILDVVLVLVNPNLTLWTQLGWTNLQFPAGLTSQFPHHGVYTV